MLVNIGALVVVAEDHGLLAEFGAGNADALLAGLVGEGVIRGENEGLGCLHGGLWRIKLPAWPGRRDREMSNKRFYHCCLLAMLLAAGANFAAHALPAEDIDAAAVRPPPRSINDITRMLADYRQHDDLVRKQTAIADGVLPQTDDAKTLFNFYWRRGLAAAELGRIQQQIADLRLAVQYGQPATGEYARALRNLAQAERLGGNFLSAQNYVNEAIKQIPQSGMGQLTGAYSQVVSLASQVGDFDTAQKALSQLESTLVTLKSGKGWVTWSHFWLSSYEKARGDMFSMAGKQLEAEAAYRRSIRESELAIADLPALIASGRDAPTVENMQQGIEGNERSIAQSLQAQGKLVEAEAMARRSLEKTLKRAGRTSPDVGRGLRVLAGVLAEQGRYEESAKLADAALESVLLSGAAPDSLTAIGAKRSTLAAQVALGHDQQALKIYDDLKKQVESKPDLAAQVLKGDLDVVQAWLRTGQAAQAEEMAAGMLAGVAKQQGARAIRTAEIRGFLAMAQADLGKSADALASFRQAAPILIERVRNDTEAEAGGMRRQQRLVLILERYIRLLAEMQAKGLLQADAANEAFMLADEARGSSVQRALTRSAARAAIKDPELADLARQEQDAQRRGNALNDLLSQLLAAAPDQQLPAIQAKIREDIEGLKQSRERLKKEIGRRFPEYSRLVDPPAVDIAQVQKMLHPGEVLLSWYFGQHGAQVWAISGDGRVRFAPIPTDRGKVAADVATLRKALTPEVATIDQIPPFDVGIASRLYRQLMGPATELLVGAKTILAVPHAELGQLPLSLLVTADTAQPQNALAGMPLFSAYREVPWLMRQVAVAQLPSVTALASLRRLPPGDPSRLPFIGFGDPFFSEEQAKQAEPKASAQVAMRGVPLRLRNVPKTQGVDSAELALLPRLPDTAQEIKDIAAALGADPARDVFLNSAASEKTVFEANLANRRVVMFATHGLVPGELDGLSQPALALSAPKVAGSSGDGLLTQEEILSLKLNADWVVLSACNTAAGEGAGSEAVSGLGRAFFYAGARALLVSNWPVETEASRRLMTDLFRRQAGTHSLAKAEALQQAMASMIDGGGKVDAKTGKVVYSYAHPLFWAPFVLVGD